METLSGLIGQLNSIVWGPAILVLTLGTGLSLMIRLQAMPPHRIGYGFCYFAARPKRQAVRH